MATGGREQDIEEECKLVVVKVDVESVTWLNWAGEAPSLSVEKCRGKSNLTLP